MKRLSALLAASVLASLPVYAEDKAPEPAPSTPAPEAPAAAPEPPADASLPPLAPVEKDKDRLELMPSKPAQIIPPPADLPLIPEIPIPQDRPPRQPSVPSPIKPKKDSATAAAEDELKQRIRLREARTKALRDPAVQAEWARAQEVKTDYERREALRSYYKMLYGRMVKLDSSLKAPADKLLKQSLATLDQDHIAPTQPPATVSAPANPATAPRAKR
jgi:hypothetical protein